MTCRLLRPTPRSREISAIRLVQAACRRARAFAHCRIAFQDAFERQASHMLQGQRLRVVVWGARNLPLSPASSLLQAVPVSKLPGARGSSGFLHQPLTYFRLQAVDRHGKAACGARWHCRPESENATGGIISARVPSPAQLPHERLHILGRAISAEGREGRGGEGDEEGGAGTPGAARQWGLLGWGRNALWKQEEILSFSAPSDCRSLRLSVHEDLGSSARGGCTALGVCEIALDPLLEARMERGEQQTVACTTGGRAGGMGKEDEKGNGDGGLKVEEAGPTFKSYFSLGLRPT